MSVLPLEIEKRFLLNKDSSNSGKITSDNGIYWSSHMPLLQAKYQ